MDYHTVLEMHGALGYYLDHAREDVFYLGKEVLIAGNKVTREENVRGLLHHLHEIIGRMSDSHIKFDLQSSMFKFERELDFLVLRDRLFFTYGALVVPN